MQPKLRFTKGRGVGDIKYVRGGYISVQPTEVEEMVKLLIDSLPSIVHSEEVYPIGFFTLSFIKKVPVRVKFINRETKRINAAVRFKYDEGFIIRFYPSGLSVRTIIHEVAHLPSWHKEGVRPHGPIFKFWQEYLQNQWFGVKK